MGNIKAKLQSSKTHVKLAHESTSFLLQIHKSKANSICLLLPMQRIFFNKFLCYAFIICPYDILWRQTSTSAQLREKTANASDHLSCIPQEPSLGTFHPNTKLLQLTMQSSKQLKHKASYCFLNLQCGNRNRGYFYLGKYGQH